jgi:hypothetical protein
MIQQFIVICCVWIPIFSFAEIKDTPSFVLIDKTPDKQFKVGQCKVSFTVKGVRIIPNDTKLVWSANDQIDTTLISKENKISKKMIAGKYSFMFYYSSDFNEIFSPITELESGYHYSFHLNFRTARVLYEVEKPVIYLYPKTKTNVTVSLETVGDLSYVYPPFNKDNTWYVTASPDGNLQQFSDAQYRYLFWESQQEFSSMPDLYNQGFYTTPASSQGILEYICNEFGLTSFEKADFITYWGPQIQQMENCFIRILFNEEVERIATLNIEPKPDHIYRIFLLIKNDPEMDEMIPVQYIPKMKRDGFTVVEWGGTIIGDVPSEKL